MRVIVFILGALLIVCGIFCMFAPIATYSALSWLIGIAMVAEGIGGIVVWNDLRKQGLANMWTLIGSIISVILGVFLLGSFVAQIAVDFFIAYLIAAWLIIAGIARIIGAFAVRNQQKQGGDNGMQVSWGLLLALGILTAILGVLCFFNPLSIMASVGLLLGMSILCVGIDHIICAVKM